MSVEGLAVVSPIEAAARIGEGLRRAAYWDRQGRLCNWVGRSPAEMPFAGGPLTPTAAALGADLYGGSSGIALILARLFERTGDPEARRVALGAIERSIRWPGRDVPSVSFFNGTLGIAFAAIRVGELTGEESLEIRGGELLARLPGLAGEAHVLDVIGGNAGAIPALLAMARGRSRAGCLDLAIALGEELLRAAVRSGPGLGWEPATACGPGFGETPLTGLSHGAAGIGLALFELHAATGRADFLEAALGAFAYEDSTFDAEAGRWPDLRTFGRPAGPDRPKSFGAAWCHGAPGIAIARLRAMTLDPARRDDHLGRAGIAIGATLEAIEATLPHPGSDASLCHGLMGLAEVVLVAGQALGDEAYRARALEVGRILAGRHSIPGDWPSGLVSGGPNPSLMLGTAGIGYAFLRLHDPAGVSSLLMMAP